MNALRRHSLLLFILLVALVAGAEGWAWRQARERAGRALSALEGIKRERDHLACLSPAPSLENEALLAREIAAWRSRLAELRDGFQPREPKRLAGPAPERPMDAFFSLAALVEKARARAGVARISLRPEEYFGFSSHAHEGPAGALLEAVHRQQLAVESLLEPLFESAPLALLGVRREPPGPVPAGGEDFFVLDPGLSVKQAGFIETEALRLEFTGQTSTLRNFLNGLSALPHPVVVRSIEVEPLPASDTGRTTAGAGPAASIPVVRQSLSKFCVTVECVLLPEVPGRPAS